MIKKCFSAFLVLVIFTTTMMPSSTTHAYTQDQFEQVKNAVKAEFPEVTDEEIRAALENAESIYHDSSFSIVSKMVQEYGTSQPSSATSYLEPEFSVAGNMTLKDFILTVVAGLAVIHINELNIVSTLKNTFYNNYIVQNGWVATGNGKTWHYKVGGNYVWNYWVKDDSGKWYYIQSDTLMFDPKYRKSNWYFAKASNTSSKKRWFEFNVGGSMKEKSGWQTYTDSKGKTRWMYNIPGNYGAATSETLTINGETFKFDDNGYCYSGRGC